MKIMPETRLGKWAVVLAGIFIVGFILTFLAAQMFFAVTGMLSVAFGMVIGGVGSAAMILDIISLTKKHERSFLAFLSLAVGLYALLFLAFLTWLTFFGSSMFNMNI
jgi:hypothetical protein